MSVKAYIDDLFAYSDNLGITAVGKMPGIGRKTGRGMCQKFGDCVFLVQDYFGRGTIHRGRPRSQMVDCTVSLDQLGHCIFHRHEGNTIVRQSKLKIIQN